MFVHAKYFTTIHGLVLPARFTLRRGLCLSFLTLVMACLSFTPAAGQIPINYRLEEIPLNPGGSGTVQANQMNNLGMVVGFHMVAGVQTGYVYDHYGLIDGTEKKVHSLTKWIPVLPEGYIASSCVGINNLGQVVGYFSNAQFQRKGYYLNLFGGGTILWDDLPTPFGSESSYGSKINDEGDVLIYSRDKSLGYLYNLALDTSLRPLTDASGTPFTFTLEARVDLNNRGQVVGNTLDSEVFRFTPDDELGDSFEITPLHNGQCSINDFGLMAGTLPATGSGKRATPKRACRYDINGQIEALSTVQSFSYDINNNGDVAGSVGGSNAIYHDGDEHVDRGWYLLDDLLVVDDEDADLLTLWNQTTGKRAINLGDRDATGFGQILALVNSTITTGSGKNKVTTNVLRFFVLTPE